MNNHIRIIDMAIDEVIDGFYILSDAKVRKSRNDSPYLCAKLTDASGSIDARFWDYAGYIMEDCTGEVVHIRGTVGAYNERKQLKVMQKCGSRSFKAPLPRWNHYSITTNSGQAISQVSRFMNPPVASMIDNRLLII